MGSVNKLTFADLQTSLLLRLSHRRSQRRPILQSVSARKVRLINPTSGKDPVSPVKNEFGVSSEQQNLNGVCGLAITGYHHCCGRDWGHFAHS